MLSLNLRSFSFESVVLLCAAAVLLVGVAIQYPLSISFPIGGDAVSYVTNARAILNAVNHPAGLISTFKGTWYPLSLITFLPTRLLPVSWPQRFIWWMVLGQVLVGAAIARFVWRLAGPYAAALAVVGWAVTAVGVNTHFEDGTLAQLWSLIYVVLFFDSLYAKRYGTTLIFFVLALLGHPISGVVVFLSLVFALPVLWWQRHTLSPQAQRFLKISTGAAAIILLAGAVLLTIRLPSLTSLGSDTHFVDLADLLHSTAGPFLVLAPLGIMLIGQHSRANRVFWVTWLSFITTCLLLALNNWLGIGLQTFRFQTYLIFIAVSAGGIGAAYVIPRVFSGRTTPVIFSLVLFLALSVFAAARGHSVFSYYAYLPNYGTLLPDEQAAFIWLDHHLPPNSTVYSTIANRNTEWIPALTSLRWLGEPNTLSLFNAIDRERAPGVSQYLIFLKHREKAEEILDSGNRGPVSRYPTVFENKAVLVIKVS